MHKYPEVKEVRRIVGTRKADLLSPLELGYSRRNEAEAALDQYQVTESLLFVNVATDKVQRLGLDA